MNKLTREQADRLLRISYGADPDSNHPTTGLLRGMQDCTAVEAAIAAAFELGQKIMRQRAADYLRGHAVRRGAQRDLESALAARVLRSAAADFADDELWEES